MGTQKRQFLLSTNNIGFDWIIRKILWGKELYTHPYLDLCNNYMYYFIVGSHAVVDQSQNGLQFNKPFPTCRRILKQPAFDNIFAKEEIAHNEKCFQIYIQ